MYDTAPARIVQPGTRRPEWRWRRNARYEKALDEAHDAAQDRDGDIALAIDPEWRAIAALRDQVAAGVFGGKDNARRYAGLKRELVAILDRHFADCRGDASRSLTARSSTFASNLIDFLVALTGR